MFTGFGLTKSVKGQIGSESVHAEHAQIRAEREDGRNNATQHCVWSGNAIALPAEPAVDAFAGLKPGGVAFKDFADGKRAHRRVQRHRRAIVPFVIGPAALRWIDREKVILDQNLSLAGGGNRLCHQRKMFGLRYPSWPGHEPYLAVLT